MSTPHKPHNPAFLRLVNDSKARVKEIDIERYKQMAASGDPHTLVDVREDSEWAAGHVAGAVHLGKGIIERDIETTAPATCPAAHSLSSRTSTSVCGSPEIGRAHV